MIRLAAWGLVALGTVAILGAGLLGTLFLWFRVPGGAWVSGPAAGLFAAGGALALAGLWTGRPLWAVPHALAAVLLLVWFVRMVPRADRDWAPDVARQMTAVVAPPAVTVRDLRDFDWRTEHDGTARWREERFDLDGLVSLDLVNSYWSGRAIAHTLLSFGFADGRHVAFSIEIRPEAAEEYSNVAGFFNEYESVVIAATERDILRLRTTFRREDVELYRLKVSRDQIRGVFLHLLATANDLAARPAFYNTLRANCTTQMFDAARTVAPDLPFDWRIILSGYVPEWAYDQGLLDTRLPFETLRERARVSAKGQAAGDAPDWSARIREGLPDPNR